MNCCNLQEFLPGFYPSLYPTASNCPVRVIVLGVAVVVALAVYPEERTSRSPVQPDYGALSVLALVVGAGGVMSLALSRALRDPVQPRPRRTFERLDHPRRRRALVPVSRLRVLRYVAIGDSSVEGLNDPDGRGGNRGWTDRIAERLAAHNGDVLYANLGVRGRTTRQVRDEQLARAVAMKPDIAVVVAGTNDVLRGNFDPDVLEEDLYFMQRSLVDAGAVVITLTVPDLSPVMPLARMLRGRVLALDEAIRRACRRSGAIPCDLARYPVSSDPRVLSDDRLHANSIGHARIADGVAFCLGLPGSSMQWAEPFPEALRQTFAGTVRAELAWAGTHLVPWVWRHMLGRSSGDGITAKRPELTPVRFAATALPPRASNTAEPPAYETAVAESSSQQGPARARSKFPSAVA
jgi:lysophospholipase L1-like esterase